MKLSELLKIGAKKRPQCYGQLHKNGASCALGAIYEARFLRIPTNEQSSYDELKNTFPEMGIIPEPPFGEYTRPMMEQIFHLNDKKWSREKIADWLESIGY